MQIPLKGKLSHENGKLFHERGELKYGEEKYDEAIKDCTRAIKLEPKNPDYYLDRSHCYFAVRKYADKHYSILLLFLISGYIHLYMFLCQFSLPKELSWEKTPMILERQEEEITALLPK